MAGGEAEGGQGEGVEEPDEAVREGVIGRDSASEGRDSEGVASLLMGANLARVWRCGPEESVRLVCGVRVGASFCGRPLSR